ncbi:MAG TPA: NYN domain-containing protein [Candidatus Paceibacterota bacterium]
MRKNLGRVWAFIDGANLDQAIRRLDWHFDYARFRVWLRERHGVERAYLFLGYLLQFERVYAARRADGYEMEFREVTFDPLTGKAKGNCDADLVLKVAVDCCERRFDRAVIVSSDGDYAGLVDFLKERGALECVVSPSAAERCSYLLRKLSVPMVYLPKFRDAVESPTKRKSPP